MRLGQTRGPRAATTLYKIDNVIADICEVRLETISWPSAAARTGKGAERCGHIYQIVNCIFTYFSDFSLLKKFNSF